MTEEPKAVVVPKELYYHEVAYVRGLEAEVKRLSAEPFYSDHQVLALARVTKERDDLIKAQRVSEADIRVGNEEHAALLADWTRAKAEIARLTEALTDIEKLSEDGTAAKMISSAALKPDTGE